MHRLTREEIIGVVGPLFDEHPEEERA